MIDDPSRLTLRQLATGFRFTEGPVWHPGGYLLFSDTPSNRIYRLAEGGETITWLEKSGFDGAGGQWLSDQVGSNGLAISGGSVIICQHGNHRLVAVEQGTETIVCDQYLERPFNSPNDLLVAPGGAIYFSDPPYGLKNQELQPERFQPHAGVYCFADGKVSLVTSALRYPNGLAISQDGTSLFVSSNHPDEPTLLRIPIDGTHTFGEPVVFARYNADGFRIDAGGRFWLATTDGIRVLDKNGQQIHVIGIPEYVSNLCFSPDGKKVFVTADKSIYLLE